LPWTRPILIALAAAALAGGCAKSGNLDPASDPETTAATAPSPRQSRSEDDGEPRAQTADPYKSVQYRGGRDPVSGMAPALDGQLPAAPPPPAGQRRASPAKASARASSEPGRTVEVMPGDTLTSIAARHKTSVAALKQANQLTSDRIVPGQRLVLP